MIALPKSEARQGRKGAGASAAAVLSLAAAPAFATMALLTALEGGGVPDICLAARDGSALTGMAAMYALMSAFHLAPWLRLCSDMDRARSRGGGTAGRIDSPTTRR